MTTVDFYDKEQVDDLLEDKADASSVGKDTDAPSVSGTLWARIKYVLAHWLTADSEQTVTAKKTFSVSPEVPTEPANDDSAVNSFYVNDSTGTVENNILHKDGEEYSKGIVTGQIEGIWGNQRSGTLGYIRCFSFDVINNLEIYLRMIGFPTNIDAIVTTSGGLIIENRHTSTTGTIHGFILSNATTGKREFWISSTQQNNRFMFFPEIITSGASVAVSRNIETITPIFENVGSPFNDPNYTLIGYLDEIINNATAVTP